jgi:hypothetical protein
MESVEDFQFNLIRHHGDYIEFSVSFKIEYNKWTAEGIGWLTQSRTNYYIRVLKLNNWPAGSHYNKKAKIALRRQSYKFHSDMLDRLANTHITHHLK